MTEQLRSKKNDSVWFGGRCDTSRLGWPRLRFEVNREGNPADIGTPRENLVRHPGTENDPIWNATWELVELVCILVSIVLNNTVTFVYSVLPPGALAHHAGRSSRLAESLFPPFSW